MLFSSLVFLLLFLPAVYLINSLLSRIFRSSTTVSNCFLLIASLVFYAWGEPVLVLLMIGSILLNWFCGVMIAKSAPMGSVPRGANAPAPMGSVPIGAKSASGRFWLILAIIGDLAILGYFKYAGFFARTLNGLLGREALTVPEIALPIGISFFTFQAISYVVDVYRGNAEASKNPINTALYISFFPQLIAGPIVKYRDINRQIESRQIHWERTAEGFRRFIYGLAKKVLIANVLGLCADTIHTYHVTRIDPVAAWVGALAYAFQIYYDFSGYSDMAIGLGKMFGFDYLENFEHPYLSKSVSEFWRRWHISLGTWFREYVYIPLGGNRKGKIRTYFNLAIVFLLTGLWHGANVTFLLWGAYHGFFVILERLGLKKLLDKNKILGGVYCFLVVVLGWVLFRMDSVDEAITYIAHMIRPWHNWIAQIPAAEYLTAKTIAMFVAAVLGAGIVQRAAPAKWREKWVGSVPEAIWCAALLVFCIATIAGESYNPFIYFQF